MPNIKSAKKRVRSDKRKALYNKRRKSELRTLLKKATDRESVLVAVRALDRAQAKGICHKNNAARHKASMTKRSR